MSTPIPTPTDGSLVLQWPERPALLLLLFHGVGAQPQHMAPLGQRLAEAFAHAAVVSVAAPQARGPGYQWFSVQDVTEDNRPARVAEALPGFAATVRLWQDQAGVMPQATALIGFSQGAIMALESTQLSEAAVGGASLSGRVVALSGRFARDPDLAPPHTTVHFVHGKHDPVMHYGHTVRAAERLVRLGADVTADVLPYLEHQVTPAVEDLVLERLQTYVPKRVWDEALRSAPQG